MMPALSYGLSLSKTAKQTPSRPATAKRKPIFGEDSDPEDDTPKADATETIETFGGISIPQPTTKPKPESKNSTANAFSDKVQPTVPSRNLATSLTASKHATTAREVDQSVYEYDEVYESMRPKQKKEVNTEGSKYIKNLLAAAEVRERDQLRAKEKMLAREREAEGDEFADKEKFVTGAYKAQQEEVRRLEAEEKKREEEVEERSKREGGRMLGFYKDLLAKEDARHEAIAKALEERKINGDQDEESEEKSNLNSELAKDRRARLNEDGEVVNKEELLQGGINVITKAKPLSRGPGPSSTNSESYRPSFQGRGSKAAMRERQTRMIEAQLEDGAKRVAEDEQVEMEALQRAAKSRKTEGEVSSARERYLQRKREAEAAKAAG